MSKHTYIKVERHDQGDSVTCDVCNEDFAAGDARCGGFLFGSYAYCPDCAVEHLPKIKGYGEEHYIKAHCPANMSFRDWVLKSLRAGNNEVRITTIETKNEP